MGVLSSQAAAANSSVPRKIHHILRAGLGPGKKVLPATTGPEDYYYNPEAFPMDDLVDIIVTLDEEDVVVVKGGEGAMEMTTTIPFLEAWRDIISTLNVIFVLGEGLDVIVPNSSGSDNTEGKGRGKDVLPGVPTWLQSFEIYSQSSIQQAWGDRAYVAGKRGLSLRNFGFWVSDRTVVYCLDKHSKPLDDTSGMKDENGHRVVTSIVGGGDKEQVFLQSKRQHQSHHSLLRAHLANLFTPATPSYFNPYYDAYRPGKDFPAGFPYDHRDGTFTAVSHGLSEGDAHYDAFTRFVKPDESNKEGGQGQEKGPVVSVSSGVLYSMAHNNVAFNRRVIGAVFMYPPTVAADGTQIMGQEDSDVLSGWISKVVCDHVGIGVKSGYPYVHRAIVGGGSGIRDDSESSSSNSSSGGVGEEKVAQTLGDLLGRANSGLFEASNTASAPAAASSSTATPSLALNRRVFEFLQSLLPSHLAYGDTKGNIARDKGCRGNIHAMEYGELNMAVDCVYTLLANELQSRLGVSSNGAKYKVKGVDQLAQSMRDWIDLFYARNTFVPSLHPVSTYSSKGPLDRRREQDKGVPATPAVASTEGHSGGKALPSTCAVITIVRDEQDLLPIWLRYYSRHIPLEDMYILDHLTTDNSTHPSKLPAAINYRVLYGNTYAMPVVFRSWQINKYQDRLLRFGYKCVIFSDTDELIVPHPKAYPGGLEEYLTKFLKDPARKFHRVHALEVGHVSYGNGSDSTVEPKFDWNNPYILSQRKVYVPDHMYDKPLLSKVPLRYKAGFHKLFTRDKIEVDPELVMLHMRSFDWDFCFYREEQKFNLSHLMKPEELASGMASHWRTYKEDKKSGALCRYAKASFFGEETSKTQYLDNTGRIPMQTFEPEWKTVMV
jgi:hypothetical protein